MSGFVFDPVYAFFLLTALTFVPLLAVLATSYTKIVIVASLLKNALGLQNVPPTTVTSSLAIVLTAFIMYPVIDATQAQIERGGTVDLTQPGPKQLFAVADAAKEPMRTFLSKHAAPQDVKFFVDTARSVMEPEVSSKLTTSTFIILVPAFALTELTEAFELGFLVFLPFIVIDFLVAVVLMSLGMQMLSPTVVSLPFKLLLFVVADGWRHLLNALLLSYR